MPQFGVAPSLDRNTAVTPPPYDGAKLTELRAILSGRGWPPGRELLAHLLLVGASGWGNVGDDLIALRISESLLRAGHSIVIVGGSYPFEVPPTVQRITNDGTLSARLRLLRAISAADAVVIGGGGLMVNRPRHYYRQFYRVARAARWLRTPYRIVAVGVAPVKRGQTARRFRWMFDHADSASVRDEESRYRLQSIGVSASPQIEADPALWPRPREHLGADCPPQYDLVVNLRPWRTDPDRSETDSAREIASVLSRAVRSVLRPGSRVALVSMSICRGEEDSIPLELLAQKLDGYSVVRAYNGKVADVERIVSGASAVVSMRLHLALMAAASDVPVLGIAYDDKVTSQGKAHGFATLDLDDAAKPATTTVALRALRSVSGRPSDRRSTADHASVSEVDSGE